MHSASLLYIYIYISKYLQSRFFETQKSRRRLSAKHDQKPLTRASAALRQAEGASSTLNYIASQYWAHSVQSYVDIYTAE